MYLMFIIENLMLMLLIIICKLSDTVRYLSHYYLKHLLCILKKMAESKVNVIQHLLKLVENVSLVEANDDSSPENEFFIMSSRCTVSR